MTEAAPERKVGRAIHCPAEVTTNERRRRRFLMVRTTLAGCFARVVLAPLPFRVCIVHLT